MDNVTHSLVGLMLARAGLNRGEKGGAVMVVLAANVPDLDGYSFFTNSLRYLEQHRAYMHALAFVPLVALIPLLLVKLVTRTRITAWSYFACVVAVLSHLLLDWTNAYGVRLMLPFSDHWFRLDINPLSEAFILLILVMSWGIPALIALIDGEVKGQEGRTPRRAWAVFALIAITVYDAGRWVSHERAISMMEERLYRGAPPERVSAFPAQLNFSPLIWHGIAEGDGILYDLQVDVTRPLFITSDKMRRTVDDDPAIDAVRKAREFQVFEKFDQLPFWKLTKEQDATRVELLDLRFGSIDIPTFRATALVESSGEVLDPRFVLDGR